MVILSFTLTMPGRGSWNGQWSGSNRQYIKHRKVTIEDFAKITEGNAEKAFLYSFGDGWTAKVTVRRVDSETKRKQQKLSVGFAQYDWMIDSILIDQKIIPPEDRKISV